MERGAISDRGFWVLAAALIAAFLLVRIVVAFSFWPRHPEQVEIYDGMIGREILKGPVFDIFDYQADPLEGGAIIVGMFVGMAFFLVGYSYAALKAVALASSLASLFLWAVLVAKIFGKRVVLWYIAAAMLPPPALLYWSLLLCGKWMLPDIVHGVGLLLILKLVDMRCALHPPHQERKSFIPILAVLGAVLGFGIYISGYFFIIAVYAVLVLVFYRIPCSLRKIIALLAGFLTGLIPWIAYNLCYGFESLKIFKWGPPGEKVYFSSAHSASEWIISNSVRSMGRMINIMLHWWFNSWLVPFVGGGLVKVVLGYAYELSILLGIVFFIAAIRKRSNMKSVERDYLIPPYPNSVRRNGGIVFGFFAFALVVTCFSNINLVILDSDAYRYLRPLMPSYLLAISVCFDRLSLCRINALRFISWTAALFLLAMLLIGNLPLLAHWDTDASLRVVAYDYNSLGVRMGQKAYYGSSQNDALSRAVRILDRQDRDDVTGYIADMSWFGLIADRSGADLAPGGGQLTIAMVEQFKSMADKNVKKRYQPIFYRGLGRGFSWSHGSRFAKIGELAGALDPETAQWAWQGVGSIEARRHGCSADWLSGALNSLPAGARGPFCEGVGAELGFEARERGDDFAARIKALPEDVRAYCTAGRELGVIRRPFVSLEW